MPPDETKPTPITVRELRKMLKGMPQYAPVAIFLEREHKVGKSIPLNHGCHLEPVTRPGDYGLGDCVHIWACAGDAVK